MKLLIVVPAYNEAGNIVQVTEEIQKYVPQYDYVIVNDGSSDQTRDLCRKNGLPLLDLPTNLGLTGAFQAGCRYACEKGYDAVIQIDGDGQHNPFFISKMAKKMNEGGYDLVVGSRFLNGKRTSTLRGIGNAIINSAIRLTTGEKVTDSTSGMRMYGKRVLRFMAFDLNCSPEPDTLAFLIRSGAKYAECQVNMRERTAGESYLSPGKSMKYMIIRLGNILLVQWFWKKGELA